MEDQTVIVIDDISKIYGKETVLDQVSMKFESGKIYGIVGRNGSGKTLIMKCICGFIHPTSGTVSINGKTIGKDIDIPEDLGVIIETPGFVNNYSGIKNLKLLAAIRGRIGKTKICEAMEMVGLDPTSKKSVGKYSLGMRQKLGIAQAIMEEPKLLILDEPMNGLDNKSVEKTRALLSNLSKKGTTIILASHNREDIDVLCDAVYYMDNGKVVSEEHKDNE